LGFIYHRNIVSLVINRHLIGETSKHFGKRYEPTIGEIIPGFFKDSPKHFSL